MHKRHQKRKKERDDCLKESFSKFSADTEFERFFDSCLIDSEDQHPFSWDSVPEGLDPSAGELSPDRAKRKRLQLQAMASKVLPFIAPHTRCVEFGAGTGHLGIFLAFIRPETNFILVESKPFTALIAKKRYQDLGLKNVFVYCGLLQDFEKSGISFHLAISLHSCGLLTDLILRLSLKRSSNYVLCPCCYGQICNAENPHWRSQKVQSLLTAQEFQTIGSSSDFTVPANDWEFPSKSSFQIAKKCMIAIDYDRQNWVREKEKDYSVKVSSLFPLNCSPKNNIIIGFKNNNTNNKNQQINQISKDNEILLLQNMEQKSFENQTDHQLNHDTEIHQPNRNTEKDDQVNEDINKKESIGKRNQLLKKIINKKITENSNENKPEIQQQFKEIKIKKNYESQENEENELKIGLPKFIHFDPSNYDLLLREKIKIIQEMFSENILEKEEHEKTKILDQIFICSSPTEHFRLRCRFQISKNLENKLCYVMWENGSPKVCVESFPLASTIICTVMDLLLPFIEDNNELREGIQAVNFLSTMSGECLISLIYQDKVLNDSWDIEASNLRNQIVKNIYKEQNQFPTLGVIGRSKNNVKFIACNCFVMEELTLEDGTKVKYKQMESSFSNPNGYVNQKALGWLLKVSKQICGREQNDQEKDQKDIKNQIQKINLLELYCGNGNHTCVLTRIYDQILASRKKKLEKDLEQLAVELDKKLCEAANYNLRLNNIKNGHIIQLHSELFCKKILKSKRFEIKREDEEEIIVLDFSVVLVDPPRAGLDSTTLKLVSSFKNIIYISCNPSAFKKNFENFLCKTHNIKEIAFFDQFPYTEHIECGFHLEMKEMN